MRTGCVESERTCARPATAAGRVGVTPRGASRAPRITAATLSTRLPITGPDLDRGHRCAVGLLQPRHAARAADRCGRRVHADAIDYSRTRRSRVVLRPWEPGADKSPRDSARVRGRCPNRCADLRGREFDRIGRESRGSRPEALARRAVDFAGNRGRARAAVLLPAPFKRRGSAGACVRRDVLGDTVQPKIHRKILPSALLRCLPR